MKRKNLILTSMVAGILAAGSVTPAFALVDLTDLTAIPSNTNADKNPARFAKETDAEKTSVLFSGGTVAQTNTVVSTGTFTSTATADGALTLKVKLGGAIPVGEKKYLRLDLDNGATFSASPLAYSRKSDGTIHLNTTNIVEHTVLLKSGGLNQSYAVFEYDATATNGVVASTDDIVTFFFGSLYSAAGGSTTTSTGGVITQTTDAGIKITGTDNDINVTYTLHNSQASADTGINGAEKLATTTSKYIEFVPSIGFTATAETAVVADVQTNFTNFTSASSAGTTTGALGKIAYYLKAPRIVLPGESSEILATLGLQLINDTTANTTAATAMTSLVETTSTLTVTGDFTMLQDVTSNVAQGTYANAGPRVFLATSNSCPTTAAIFANTVTAENAVFNIGSTTLGVDGLSEPTAQKFLCIKPNGVTAMSGGKYSVDLALVAKENFVAPTFETIADIGEVKQNGTVLDTPYITKTDGYISRIMLTNTSDLDAAYTTQIVTDESATVTPGSTATGVLKANSNLQINASTLIDAFSAKPRGAVRFTIAAPNKKIQGVYQTINITSGDVQSIPMIRPGGGNGQ